MWEPNTCEGKHLMGTGLSRPAKSRRSVLLNIRYTAHKRTATVGVASKEKPARGPRCWRTLVGCPRGRCLVRAGRVNDRGKLQKIRKQQNVACFLAVSGQDDKRNRLGSRMGCGRGGPEEVAVAEDAMLVRRAMIPHAHNTHGRRRPPCG